MMDRADQLVFEPREMRRAGNAAPVGFEPLPRNVASGFERRAEFLDRRLPESGLIATVFRRETRNGGVQFGAVEKIALGPRLAVTGAAGGCRLGECHVIPYHIGSRRSCAV